MAKTLLVETLLERDELQHLHNFLPVCEKRSGIERRLAVCEHILEYLRTRYVELNRDFTWGDTRTQRSCGTTSIDAHKIRAELATMNDSTLLRYGAALRYICSVEASPMGMPLDASLVTLEEARREWQRRFGNSVLAGSV